ncbi:hypothetical protein [Thermus scotoductus]|uniref:hypothetical protein n=1 Tax=Thermus scotoductus TaxID=37636 RepID=UPI0020A2DE9C|nr:hypothetical protein [Thermus scotoductus]
MLPSRSSGGYPDPWGTSSPVGTPIHTHTLTHNSLHDQKELWERSQAVALGTVFPGRELEEVKKILEEAWLELVLVASPKAEGLSRIIGLLERYLLGRSPR